MAAGPAHAPACYLLLPVTGIMVTTKKRQDFRIQLQKRARRRAEKKIEYLEDDKNWKDVSEARALLRGVISAV